VARNIPPRHKTKFWDRLLQLEDPTPAMTVGGQDPLGRMPRPPRNSYFVTFPFGGEVYAVIWDALGADGQLKSVEEVEAEFEAHLNSAPFVTYEDSKDGRPYRVRIRASWIASYTVWR
jgi:hypothetical protein